MKVSNDATRVFETTTAKLPTAARAQASPSTVQADNVQISAAAGALAGTDGESQAKVEALKGALARGENIVDVGRIADGIMADARGEL